MGTGSTEPNGVQLRDEWKSVKPSSNPKPDIIRPSAIRAPSKTPEREEEQGADPGAQSPDDASHYPAFDFDFEVKEQDRWLPIANVARTMKLALPEHAKITREAKECMQECVSEFISFVTSEAAEKCQMEKRKTVSGEDVTFAMVELGFENYAEALKIYLARYREALAAREANQRAGGAGSYDSRYAHVLPSPQEEVYAFSDRSTDQGQVEGGVERLMDQREG